jgi:hypothetical protein
MLVFWIHSSIYILWKTECKIKKITISIFIEGKFPDRLQNGPIKQSQTDKMSPDKNKKLI